MKYRKIVIFLITVISLFALFMPYFLRNSSAAGIPIGDSSYKDMRIAEKILSNPHYIIEKPNSPNSDFLGLHHLILALSAHFIGISLSVKIIPVLSGVASLILVYFLLKEYKVDFSHIVFFMLILVLSSTFIYVFSVFNIFCLIVPLVLLALILLNQESWLKYASIGICLAMPLFGINIMIVSLIAFFILAVFFTAKRRLFIDIFFSQLLIGILYLLWFYYMYGIPVKHFIILSNLFSENLSLFGAVIGFSLFLIIISLLGVFSSWNTKKQHSPLYFLALLFGLASIFLDPLMKVPLLFIFVYFASLGFVWLLNTSWRLRIVGDLTILCIIIGLIMSPFFYTSALVSSEPNENMVNALMWLNKNAAKNETVFTSYNNGYWTQYYTSLSVVMDKDFEYMRDAKERYNDTVTLLKTRDYKIASAIIEKYSIDYILIDKKMEPLMRSENNAVGLPFLLENIPSFRKVYQNGGVEIWKVFPSE